MTDFRLDVADLLRALFRELVLDVAFQLIVGLDKVPVGLPTWSLDRRVPAIVQLAVLAFVPLDPPGLQLAQSTTRTGGSVAGNTDFPVEEGDKFAQVLAHVAVGDVSDRLPSLAASDRAHIGRRERAAHVSGEE